jgi:hypothetical protein
MGDESSDGTLAPPWSRTGNFNGPCGVKPFLFVGNKDSYSHFTALFGENVHRVAYIAPTTDMLSQGKIYTPTGDLWVEGGGQEFPDPGDFATQVDVEIIKKHAEVNCTIFKASGAKHYSVVCKQGRNRSQGHAFFVRQILEDREFVGFNENDSCFKRKFGCGLFAVEEGQTTTRSKVRKL